MKTRILWCATVLVLGVIASDAAVADMPDYYSEPGFSVTRDYPELSKYETVDPFTGKLQLHHTDILIKGEGGMDLAITRSYTSSNDSMYNFWTMHLGRIVDYSRHGCASNLWVLNSHNPTLELPDGSQQVMSDVLDTTTGNSYYYLTTRLWKGNCTTNAQGLTGFNITSPEGTTYQMDYLDSRTDLAGTHYTWYPSLITDRNGNWIQITYVNLNGNGVQIDTIQTIDGTILTFHYGPPPGPNTPANNSYQVLTSITDNPTAPDKQRTWSYTYTPEMAGPTSQVIGAYQLTQVTLPDGTSWKYTYNGNIATAANANGGGSYQISSVTNPMGGISSYSYGPKPVYFYANRLPGYPGDTAVTSRTVSGVGTWTYAYNPSGNPGIMDVTTVKDPLNQVTTYSHFGYNTAAPIGEVWKIGLLMQKKVGKKLTEAYTWSPLLTSPQQNSRAFAYTGKTDPKTYVPMLASKTITQDGATYTTTNSNFDTYGHPLTVTEAGPNGGDRVTNYAYDINTGKWCLHQVKSENVTWGIAPATQPGTSISRTFDANCNLQSLTRDTVTTSYQYDTYGNVAVITYPRAGRVYKYSYYFHGVPQLENQPENVTIQRGLDFWGNVQALKNGRGYITYYTYDALNRVTSIQYPLGAPISISYTPTSKTTTRGNLTEVVNYNGFGLPVSVTLGGIGQAYGYDPLFRRTYVSNPTTGPATAPGLIGSAVCNPAGTGYGYDQLNRVVTVINADCSTKTTRYGAGTVIQTDELNNKTTHSYRSYGDPGQSVLMHIAAPIAKANVTITRNGHDQVTSVMQNGLTRTYGYDPVNYYLRTVSNPETGITSYGRDEEGNMTSRQVGASGITSYTYDLQNRLVTTNLPGAATPVTQQYTQTNKLSSVSSASSSRSYTYDANDRLTDESLVVDGVNLTASYGYDGYDHLNSITYPYSARQVSFSPDVLGRPTIVQGYVTNVTYWPSGQVQQINYQNGTVTTYGQNARLWPSSFVTSFVTQPGATPTMYVNSSYAYDLAGNLKTISDTANLNFARTFTYDAINRLIGADGPWGIGTINYDGTGNILSQSYGASTATYAYNPTSNRLSSISGTLRTATYAYDNYGNISSDGTGKTYTYDDAPNLVNYSDAANSYVYAYDGLSKRVSVTKNAEKTYEFYGADGKLLVEYTPSQTNKLVEYLYLGDKRIAQRVTKQ